MPTREHIKATHVEIREHIELSIGPKMTSQEIAGYLVRLSAMRPDRRFYVDRKANCIMSKPRRSV